ncbi:MAG: hypothetical protein J0H74_11235 [Chitinophagaceae bacterium]|nr:hypothetical protein [Chitinophagaceae bacterium]
MKKFINLLLLSALVCLSMSVSPVNKHNKKTLVNIYTANGTAFYGTLKMCGSLNFTFSPTTTQYAGQVDTGPCTVTITCGAPGTHTYMFTGGYSQTTSSGSVTFNNVNVAGTSTASVY